VETGGAIEEAVRFPSGALGLSGVLAYPASGEPRASLLVLAPHPHMGGRMDNNVVRHLARRAAESGFASLRFDYRGIGDSQIELPRGTSLYDHWAELERARRYDELLPDCEAAAAFLARTTGGLGTRVLVGYSLGAVLAGMLAPRVAATHVVGVAPPVARVSLTAWRSCAAPKLLIAGDRDFAFDADRCALELAALPEPRRFVAMPGADHFFRKQEERVWSALSEWLSEPLHAADSCSA
jgi:alpha/beta superfamily hydrolase